jgi:hypothetical protein
MASEGRGHSGGGGPADLQLRCAARSSRLRRLRKLSQTKTSSAVLCCSSAAGWAYCHAMSNQADHDVNELYQRAVKQRVNYGECAALQRALGGQKELPMFCSQLLQAAQQGGLLARRNSSVGRVWKMGEHGVNRLGRTEPVAGGAVDSVDNPADEASIMDMYMETLSPSAKEKVRRMHVRAASQGATPRVGGSFEEWAGSEENQTAVHHEVRKELVRRASRRDEMKNLNAI